MRYPASEKLEIIRLVEQSHLGVGSTLDKLGIPKTTFYRWYDRFLAFGDAGLEDRNSSPGRVWNRIPDDVRGQIIDLALEETQLSPRELAVRFTDTSVSPNCKSPICANPKLLTFWLVDDGAPGRDVGFANRAGKVCRCTDGRSGCC